MIGPVSETGKVMLSSLQGAMAKGMPVDQAITYVKSMAQQGVAPLVDLYALLRQFERMKQPPAPMPQGGNLKEQLNNLESAVVNQGLGGMRPGAMPAAPQMPPDMQGLASLDAGRMENPQGFAGGGIVAFAEGGQPEERRSITPELYTLPKTYEELARRDLEARMKLETPEGREAFEAERDAEMKRRGLGKYAPSLGLREAYAARKGREAEALSGEEAALNEEAFWADVAGTDQPDLISAMAKSKTKAVERKRTSKEKVAAAKDKAEDLKILRQEAREALARGDYEAYEAKKTEIKNLEKTSVEKYVTGKETEKAQERAATRAQTLARIQTDTPVKGVQEALRTTPQYLPDGSPNPKYGELRRLLNDLQSGRGGANRQEVAYRKNIYDKAVAALKEAQRQEDTYGNEDTAARLEAAQRAAEQARIAYEAASLGDVSSETVVDTGVGVPDLPADFIPDQP
jgi:hypothetical protein